jgi:Family of unknown function (DUF5996)
VTRSAYVDARGLTRRRLHASGVSFEIDFDFLEHRLAISTSGARPSRSSLSTDSPSPGSTKGAATLAWLGVDVAIRETPFGVPMRTPFPEDRKHASYHSDAVERCWRILDWTDEVFEQFAGWFSGRRARCISSGTRSISPSPVLAGGVRHRSRTPIGHSEGVLTRGFRSASGAGDQKVREPGS